MRETILSVLWRVKKLPFLLLNSLPGPTGKPRGGVDHFFLEFTSPFVWHVLVQISCLSEENIGFLCSGWYVRGEGDPPCKKLAVKDVRVAALQDIMDAYSIPQ